MRDANRVFAGMATVSMWRLLVVLGLGLGLACSPPSPVVQGPVVSVDRDAKTITLQDESKTDQAPMTFHIGQAEIGAQPEVGDEVRLVYRVEAGRNMALRVMNLTQQKERDKKGT